MPNGQMQPQRMQRPETWGDWLPFLEEQKAQQEISLELLEVQIIAARAHVHKSAPKK